MAAGGLLPSGHALAAQAELKPAIQFSEGLTGKQGELRWVAEPGARYRIRSSTDLSGVWRDRAVVTAAGTDGVWQDPEKPSTRAFYSIEIPTAEVFSVSPAVVSTGSTLIIKAQCLPAGCSIVFDLGGVPPVLISAPLEPDGVGQYRATISSALPSGEPWAKQARIVDALGAEVVAINQTLEITKSGFASDSPPSPPAIYKKMMGAPKIGEATRSAPSNRPEGLPGEVCLEQCDLSVPVPAGPPLDLVRTYRSMGNGGSGARWEHCFDVRIEPMPAGSGVDATCILLHTGDGRRDVLLRQADGTFSADGMFRTGVFKPDTSFELTFADHSKFIFCPLVGAPWRGRIGSIQDANGVALTCEYSPAAQLTTVSSQFGQSLTFGYDSTGRVNSVTDHTGRFVSYIYFAQGETGGNPGDLKSASCPQLPGQTAIQGARTFTYSTGFADARRNGQLLDEHDGAGRLVCAYTYSSSANDTDADFARCVSMNTDGVATTDAPMTFSYEFLPSSGGFAGGLRCTRCDEVGRVVECDFDKQWRCVRTAEFTGFATPGVPVTATTNRPTAASKLRSTDPDSYIGTCDYNADHCCTVCTEEDGLKTVVTYARDLSRNCPVLERGNARITTLRSPFGEERTVACDFLAGFGTCEGGGCGMKKFDWAPKLEGGKEGLATAMKASDGKKHFEVTEHFEMTAKLTAPSASIPGIGQPTPQGKGKGGRVTMISFGTFSGSRKNARSGMGSGDPHENVARNTVQTWGDPHENLNGRIMLLTSVQYPYCVRMTTSLGQTCTWGYDEHGNCTARTAPVGGGTCIRNPFGQVTRLSVNNDPTPLITDINYDPITKFCASVVQDPAGLALTVAYERDALKRINRVIDERGNDTLISYNECDQVVTISSPPVGTDAVSAARIVATQFYDAGGLPVRCDLEHRDAAGGLVAANPAYTSFSIYDSRGRLTGEAREQKPVDFPVSTLVPTAVDLLSCDVCNYALNSAGECTRITTPAASIGQAVDLVSDYQYDERGLLFRCIEGGLGTADAVTTECDYTHCGQTSHFRRVVAAPLVSPTVSCLYDGFRRLQTYTDEMGNVTDISYDNKGYATVSVYGEPQDVPGSTGNVLMARGRAKAWMVNNFNARSNQPIVTKDCDNFTQGGMRSNQPIVTKDVDNISGRLAGSPFFDYQEADQVCVVERFTPGQTEPHALETSTVHYSPAGLAMSEVCNGDTRRTYGYDTAGRLTTCVRPGVTSTVCTLDAGGNPTTCVVTAFSTIVGTPAETFTTTRGYDPLGRQVSNSDSMGNAGSCDFDSLGRATRCVQPGGLITTCDFDTLSPATGEFSSCTTTQSNAQGLVLSTSSSVCLGGFCSREVDPLGYVTTHACDAHGRRVLTSYADGTSESCTFDNLGHPVTQVRKNGAIIAADFDFRGRCGSTTCASFPSDVVPVPTTVCVYSGLDDCVQLTQGTSVISRTFDSCGNEVSETQNGRQISRTFSHRGRTGIIYPTGERFSEARNAQGQLVSVSRMSSTGQVLVPAISAREYSGWNCVKETRANGIVTTYDFRSDGEPPIGAGSSLPLVEDFSFGTCVRTGILNPLGGNLEVAVTRRNADQCVAQTVNNFGGPARVHNFTLDARNLVTGSLTRFRVGATAPLIIESEVSYELDGRGQRLSKSGGTFPGSYASEPGAPLSDVEMGQYTKWPGGQLTWDDNGSLTDLSRGATGLHLIYDAYSRLVEVEDASSNSIATYTYDACDRLVSSVLPGTAVGQVITTRFLYDGKTCVQETDSSDVPQRTYACASGSAICIVPINGDPIYPHGGIGTNINTTESNLKDIPPAACMGDDFGGGIGTNINTTESNLKDIPPAACMGNDFGGGIGTNINTTESNLKDIPPAACMGGSSSSARLKVWQLMQGQSGTTAMRWTPLVPKPRDPVVYRMLITSATGTAIERTDCDDAGQPIFLDEVGAVRAGATSTLSHYNWIKACFDRASLWCPESGLIQCDDGVYSPELGRAITTHCDILIDMKDQSLKKNYVGHVTLIKQ